MSASEEQAKVLRLWISKSLLSGLRELFNAVTVKLSAISIERRNMLTLDETWDLARNLNEEAHGYAWDTWVEADNLMNSDDEADWEEAESKQEEAS